MKTYKKSLSRLDFEALVRGHTVIFDKHNVRIEISLQDIGFETMRHLIDSSVDKKRLALYNVGNVSQQA